VTERVEKANTPATLDLSDWPRGIYAITLFVEDLAATKAFYVEVFGLPVHFKTKDNVVLSAGSSSAAA
jgi:catechol-2,3-dioxygenase